MEDEQFIEKFIEDAFDAILTEAEGRELSLNLTDEVESQEKAG